MPGTKATDKTATTTNVRDLLQELSRPRLSGTTGAQEVNQLIRARFTSLGYQIRDYPFTYSTIPGRFSVTAAGVVFLLGTLAVGKLMQMHLPGVALSVLLLVLLLVGGIAVLTPVLSGMLPFQKVSTANFMAYRPGSRPRYLVMAHYDSKSQPLPLAFRGPAMVLAIVVWIGFVVFATLAQLDTVWIVPGINTALTLVGALAGLLCVFCWVDNRSPGALDNATGVATVLGVAERNRDADEIGYLITDAEEMGLVGSRDIARKLDPVIGIINVDGVDDHGPFHIMEKFGVPPRHIAPHLVAGLLSAAAEQNVHAQRRNVPFGLLLDHIPLARRHLPSVTVLRGTLGSMLRVHRPTDSMDHLNGAGVTSAVALIDRALRLLRESPSSASL